MHIATVEEVEVTISKVKYDGNFRDRLRVGHIESKDFYNLNYNSSNENNNQINLQRNLEGTSKEP